MATQGTYIDVIVNNKPISAFVDSGCLCLATVSPRAAAAANTQLLPISPRPLAQVVDTDLPPSISTLAVFSLDLDGYKKKTFAYVVPGQSEDLILGKRWLENHDASIRPLQQEVLLRQPFHFRLKVRPINPDLKLINTNSLRLYRLQAQKKPSIQIFSASIHDIEKALQPKTYTDPRQACPEWLLPVIDAFDRKKAAQLPPNRPRLDTQIELLPDTTLPACPLYSMSKDELLVLRKTLYELLDSGFIRASSSAAGAPVIFVKKPGGGIRFCVDYRALNSITVKDGYPLPLIQDTLRDISQARWVSKVDVISAFHRLRIRAGDESKTAFRTRLGAYEWLVTPFGLCGAPAAFQRFINDTLGPWLGICCSAYLDDVIIYTNGSQSEHRDIVKKILRALADAGLQLDWDKSDFEATLIKYLGFIIEPTRGIRTDPTKTEAVEKWETPRNVRAVRSFLGFANFYRLFVPDYSTISTPLTLLTRKDQPWVWGPDQQSAFNLLKRALTNSPLLVTFSPDLETVVETDASGFALGGVLQQRHPDGLKPVAYYSRKFTPAEINYPVHDKEMLAIHSCLREWRPQLMGNQFTVHTDHRNLVYFQKLQTLVERQRRWAYELSEFNFQLIHKPGITQIQSDALSRRPQDAPDNMNDERLLTRQHQLLQAKGDTFIVAAAVWAKNPDCDQPSDKVTAPIRDLKSPFAAPDLTNLWSQALQQNQRYFEAQKLVQSQARSFPTEWGIPWQISECSLDSDLRLYWRNRLWIPFFEPLRTTLIQQCHDHALSGHPGTTITRDLIAREYTWPGLTDDVRRFVANCGTCGKGKVWREQKRGLLKPLPIPDRPWQELAMDFIVGLPPSCGFTNILGITDRLSKSQILIPLAEITAQSVADALFTHVIAHHGPSRAIVSDRGPQFTSLFWAIICQRLGTMRRLSTAFHPETDGAQERNNQEIETYLRAFTCFAQDDWSSLLPIAQIALNNRTSSSTGLSPFFITHGYHLELLEQPAGKPGSPNSAATLAELWLDKRRNAIAFAQASLAAAQDTQERHANRGRQAAEAFQPGDKVLLRLKNIKTVRPSKKLD